MLQERPVAKAADLLRPEERKDDGALGPRSGGEKAGERKNSSRPGGVIIGAVIDYVSIDRWPDAEMIQVRSQQHYLSLQARPSENRDSVPGLFARPFLKLRETLLQSFRQRGREGCLLQEAAVVSAWFKTQRLKLRGSEECGNVLVAGGRTPAMQVIVRKEVHIGANLAFKRRRRWCRFREGSVE